MTKELKRVAFDGGNGTVAIKTKDGEWIKPAVGRKLPPENREKTYRHMFDFGDGDVHMLCDPDDSRVASVEVGNIPERYYNGTTLRFLLALLYTAYSDAKSIEIEELSMCVPLSVYLDTSNDEKIFGCFEREHVVNGTKVNIKRVFIYPEGEAALDSLPGYTRKGKTLVIDIGFSTTDIVLVDRGEIQESTVLYYPLGIRELRADRKKILKNPKDYADSDEVKELVSALNGKYSKVQIDYVVVIGGGAYVYKEALEEYGKSFRGVLQTAKWLDVGDPELLNVRGMYA
jgi:hypothetical protein